jgi:hypothetical protein
LYDVFFKNDPDFLNYKITTDLKDPKNLKRRKQVAQIKQTLAIYGQELLKYQKEPNTLFVLVKPSLLSEADIVLNDYKNVSRKDMQHKLVEEMFSLYEKTMKRFYEFGEKNLAKRFQVTDYDPIAGSKKFLEKEVLDKLDSKVKIVSFGEYLSKTDGCVNKWTKLVIKYFKKMKIDVVSAKISLNKSLYLYNDAGIKKKIVSGSDRRKLLGSHRRQRKKLR